MRINLFAREMDYVFFFYGASFIILGAICFAILRRGTDRRPFPWWWLGLFGFIHGLNEWLDMVAISLGDSPLFRLIRLFVLAVSFVFLMEFSRRAHPLVFDRSIGTAFYPFFFVVASLGAWWGWPGINAMVRYCFGFVSALWASVLFLRYKGSEEAPLSSFLSLFLKLSGCGMFFYAFVTGLIVPRADFFPASVVNTESFLSFFHVPVQFFRAIFAFTIASGIILFSIEQGMEAFVKKERARQRRFLFVSAAAIISVLCLFYLGGQFVSDQGRKVEEVEQGTRHLKAKIFVHLVTQAIARLQGVQAISVAPAVVDFLKNPDPVRAGAVNDRLDHFKDALSADVCYLMDTTGLTLASSNRDTPKSFVGQNYAFRPYFTEAMKGRGGVYLAKGITSQERGVYVSCPVFDIGKEGQVGAILGVAVFKATMDEMGPFFQSYPYVFLVSPEGVIFVASRPEWVFRSMRDLTPQEKTALRASRQFGDGPWDNVGFQDRDDESGTVSLKNQLLFFVSEPIEQLPGWKIYFLESTSRVASARFVTIMIFLSFFLLIAIVALFIFRISLDTLNVAASETVYEALVEGSTDCILLIDKEGRCLSVNRNGLAMMGWKKEDVIGRPFLDLWPPEYREKITEEIKGVLGGKKQSLEVTRFKAGGMTMVTAVTLAPILEPNREIKYFNCIARDITKEKQGYDQLMHSSKMATVGALATGVSHEFNNVLEIILGNAEMAYASKDPEMIKKSLMIIVDSARRAAWITKTMLEFSGKASEARELVDLQELLKQNLVFLEKIFETNAIAVETHFNDVPRIYCNPAQMSQVFINIMLNARDAMRGLTEKRLTVSLEYNIPTSEILITFRDTGTGIKKEVRDKLFGPFVTTKGILGGGEDKQPGIGLGLFVAYGIIKQYNGHITVESEEGKGSAFILSLPIFYEEQDLTSKPSEGP